MTILTLRSVGRVLPASSATPVVDLASHSAHADAVMLAVVIAVEDMSEPSSFSSPLWCMNRIIPQRTENSGKFSPPKYAHTFEVVVANHSSDVLPERIVRMHMPAFKRLLNATYSSRADELAIWRLVRRRSHLRSQSPAWLKASTFLRASPWPLPWMVR